MVCESLFTVLTVIWQVSKPLVKSKYLNYFSKYVLVFTMWPAQGQFPENLNSKNELKFDDYN